MKLKLKVGAVVLLAGAMAIAGCSSNSSNGNGNASNAPASAKASESASSPAASPATSVTPVNLTWFSDVSFWNPPSTWNTDPKSVQGAITEKTGLTFDFNIPAQDGGTKLTLMLVSSDKLPDIITSGDGAVQKKLVDSGNVWNLDEFLQKYDPDSPLLSSGFPADMKNALIERDGGWFAFPSHIFSEDARTQYPPSSQFYDDAFKNRGNNAVMFNKQIMEQAGLTLDNLKTEDDVLAALKKVQGMSFNGSPVIPLQIDGKGYAGINIGELGHGGTLGSLEQMFGAMPVDKDGNYRDVILAPETKHAIDFLYKALKDGDFDVSQMTVDTSATKAAVKSGRVFAFIGNTANTGFSDEDAATNWVSSGAILSNQNTKPVYGSSSRAGTGWLSTFISKDAPNPERIAKWLDFMTSDEGLRLISYGFEGTDYTLDADGLVVQTEQGMKDEADYSTTGVGAFWPFANTAWHDHVTAAPKSIKGNSALEAMDVQTALGKVAEHFDNTPLIMPNGFIEAGTPMANKKAQMITYLEAQVSKIILSKDEASRDKAYSETIAKLKEMGLDEINTKINEQFKKQEQSFGVTVKGINS